MKRPKNLLSPEQDALFDERIRYWQDRLSLHDWRIERAKRKPSAMADIDVNLPGRNASYTTGDFGAAEITFDSIDSTACHEVVHVLVAEALHLAAAVPPVAAEVLESAEHRIVNTLEKVLRRPTP